MPIKFTCLNLYNGELLEKASNFLVEQNADIVVMQEVYGNNGREVDKQFRSLEFLQEKLKYPHFHFAPTTKEVTDKGIYERGNLILSKFPILETKIIFYETPYSEGYKAKNDDYSDEPRNLQYAKIDVNGKKLNIFNTHGIWGFDGFDNERRLKMADTIIENLKNKDKVILAGDFNLFPNTQSIKNIEKYLLNVFKGKLKTSFNIKRKTTGSYFRSVVDMMFISKNIKVIESVCPQVDVSDHLPLVAVFKI